VGCWIGRFGVALVGMGMASRITLFRRWGMNV